MVLTIILGLLMTAAFFHVFSKSVNGMNDDSQKGSLPVTILIFSLTGIKRLDLQDLSKKN